MTVTAEDADGNEITKPGKYYNPITFTDTDKFGEISFSRKRLTAPGQKVELEYTGGPMNGAAMISAEAKGVHKSDVTPATFDPKNDWPFANGIVEHWNDQNGNELPFYEEIKSNVKMQRSIAPPIFKMPVVDGPLCVDSFNYSGGVANNYFVTIKVGSRYALEFVATAESGGNRNDVVEDGPYIWDYLPQKGRERWSFPWPDWRTVYLFDSGEYYEIDTYKPPRYCERDYTLDYKSAGPPLCRKEGRYPLSASTHDKAPLPSACVVGPGIPTEGYALEYKGQSLAFPIDGVYYIAPDFGVVCIYNTDTQQADAVRDVSMEPGEK